MAPLLPIAWLLVQWSLPAPPLPSWPIDEEVVGASERLEQATGWRLPEGAIVVYEEEYRGAFDWIVSLPEGFEGTTMCDGDLKWVDAPTYQPGRELVERYLSVRLPEQEVSTADAIGKIDGRSVRVLVIKLDPRQCVWIQFFTK
ncbi:MAG: hypothetical protein ACF8NJ_08110 [Phycisphaerales bacterium JB038]